MKSLRQHILEGRNDPSIFHAVFMAGAPGAGKSFVADSMALPGQLGYKEINSDIEFTRYMKSAGLTDEKGTVILDPNRKWQSQIPNPKPKLLFKILNPENIEFQILNPNENHNLNS